MPAIYKLDAAAGTLATETFRFGNESSFTSVAFGCAASSGPASIIRQLDVNDFSYCLTSPLTNHSGKIIFGSDAAISVPQMSSIPLLLKPSTNFYHATLQRFSVGNNKLKFTYPATHEGNIIFDTGTTTTFLPRPFYDQLEPLFVEAINRKRIYPPSKDGPPPPLCYAMPANGELIRLPPVIAHFRGADIVLKQEGLVMELMKGMACLSIWAWDYDFMLFGNVQQINYFINIDLLNQRVNFLPSDEGCNIHRP